MALENKYRIERISELYKADWSNPTEFWEIGDFQVPLPKKPTNPKLFKNWGLDISQQKFKREHIPPDLKKWDKQLQNQFIEVMYHKRNNGEWWLIGGKETYITGKAWMYLNFWTIEAGGKPTYRYEAVEFFLFWEMCRRDPNCYGMLDIKARRLGDTEKSLFIMWEVCTRWRNSHGGMQNIKEDDAADNFERIVNANNEMIWFFKPITAGLDKPKNELVFDYPSEVTTARKLRIKKKNGGEDEYADMQLLTPALKGKIDFETTKKGRYDGKRLRIYHLDEPGKILEMSPKKQWEVVKPCLHLYNGEKIIGKAIFTTTVEDFEESDVNTMEEMKWFWKNSDPKERDGNGRTITGLYRYFRSCVLGSKPDEFGFVDKEKTLEFINNTVKKLQQIDDFDGLASFKRKQPITIDDVFSIPHNQCVLYPVLLDRRLYQIEHNLCASNNKHIGWDGNLVRPKAVIGNLVWANRFGGDVKWVPDTNGKWHISQHPHNPSRRQMLGNHPKPVNDASYTFGADPVDAIAEGEGRGGEGGGSKGAGAVFRRYDESVDGHLDKDEFGNILETWKMHTSQYVCDYLHRPEDPNEYFEDMLKTAIYYSTPMFYERDKPSIGVYFNSHGFGAYLKSRPLETRNAATKLSKRNRNKEKGAKASPDLIRLYVDALKMQVSNFIDTFNHPRILSCHRQFNVKNRTKRDLTVACAFCQLADMDNLKPKLTEMRERFDGAFWQLYDRHTQR